jgi:hypothetical protein
MARLKVKGYESLIRDTRSNGIVNTNTTEYSIYMSRVRAREKQGDEIRSAVKENKMAARTVLTTDTLETFRTTFNSLSSTDIGDVATLTTTSTEIVGAINELDTAVSSGITIGSTSISLGGTASSITGLTSFDATTITENSVRVATQPFAIAQAIALG